MLDFAPAAKGDGGEPAPELPPEKVETAVALFTAAAIVGRMNPVFSPDERRFFVRTLKSIRGAVRPSPSPEAIHTALALLHHRQVPHPRMQPRPRAVALPRRREAPGRGPAPPTGPPGDDSGEEDGGGDEESSDPPPPPPRPRGRGRGRGRPRKARRFRAFPDSRTYKKRLQKLDAVAAALEGRGDGLFITLVPLRPPAETDRRLAAVPRDIARAFSGFAARLRRAGGTFALVAATRAENGTFYPHAHGLVAGVSREKLGRWAAREGLKLHLEDLRDPRAAARYLAAGGQKRPWDVLLGGRGFYAQVSRVSSRNKEAETEGRPLVDIPAGLEIAPGVRIVDPDTFLAALARALGSRIPAIREAARHQLGLLQAALAKGVPP